MPLSDWWATFGITNEETFVEKVSPYMPSFRYLGFGWDGDQMSRYAWANPGSGFGSVATTVLSVQALHSPSDSQLRATASDAARYVDTFTPEEPMTPLVVPGCFLVSINATSGGQQVVNVLGVRNSGGTALGAAQAVLAGWKVSQGPLVKRPSAYSMVAVRAMDISSVNGAIAEVQDSGIGGLAGSAIATNAACALIKWNGSTRSKSSRGRLYHGPLAETDINNDGRTLVPAAITGLVGAYQACLNSMSTAGYPLVVISRKQAQAYTVGLVQVETVIATQRRRIR